MRVKEKSYRAEDNSELSAILHFYPEPISELGFECCMPAGVKKNRPEDGHCN